MYKSKYIALSLIIATQLMGGNVITKKSIPNVNALNSQAEQAFEKALQKVKYKIHKPLREKLLKQKSIDEIDVVITINDETITEIPDGKHYARIEYNLNANSSIALMELDGKPALVKDFDDMHERVQKRLAIIREEKRVKRLGKLEYILAKTNMSNQKKEALLKGNAKGFIHKMNKSDLVRLINENIDLINYVWLPVIGDPSLSIHDELVTHNIPAINGSNINTGFNGAGTGNGVIIVHTEGSVTVDTDNQIVGTAVNKDYATDPISEHATQTMGVLQAVAPDATYYSYSNPTPGDANCNLPIPMTVYTGIVNPDGTQTLLPPIVPHIISMSYSYPVYGDYSMCDKAWDNFIYDYRSAGFVVSGNTPSWNADHSALDYSTRISSPGKSYNIITVGASETDAVTHDNRWVELSRSTNPTYDLEKPDIVAPGKNINIGTYSGLEGTSFATPYAAGVGAILMQFFPTLKFEPHLLKATMMAAIYNANLSHISSYDNKLYEDYRDQKDGAGETGIAYGSFSMRLWNGRPSSYTTNNAGVIEFDESIIKGKRYRIAISWLIPGDLAMLGNNADHIPLDLNLEITQPNGTLISSAITEKNNVDFMIPANATYSNIHIKISKRKDPGSSVMGFYLGYVRFLPSVQ